MSIESLVARTFEGLDLLNTLEWPTFPVRFQIAPGTGSDLGIAKVDFSVLSNGVQIASGQTDANGEVQIPLLPVFFRGVCLRIFSTDYDLAIHPGLEPIDTLKGQQKRLEIIGYVSGYQLIAIASSVPDDGSDGPRTQQSIMNFQTDGNLDIDGEIGPRTTKLLKTQVGE